MTDYFFLSLPSALCDCDAGFSGDDCSIDESKPPVLDSIENVGVCDTLVRNCTQVTLYGANFADKDTLTCHLEEARVTIRGI